MSEAQFHEATAFCAPNGLRRAALHRARMAEQKAAKLARVLQRKYGVDPNELLARGEIK
jgi:hypothetical protein